MRSVYVLLAALAIDAVAVAAAVVMGTYIGRPMYYFGERKLITWLSFLQLLTVAWLTYRICQVRAPERKGPLWRSPQAIWALMALGFVFLACDDLFMIHEKLEGFIHRAFHLKRTAFTGHIDDMIMGSYVVAGLAALIVCRREVARCLTLRPYLLWAFVVMFLMLGFDAVIHRQEKTDVFVVHFGRELGDRLHILLHNTEESLKVFSQAIFIAAFYHALQKARGLAAPPAPAQASEAPREA